MEEVVDVPIPRAVARGNMTAVEWLSDTWNGPKKTFGRRNALARRTAEVNRELVTMAAPQVAIRVKEFLHWNSVIREVPDARRWTVFQTGQHMRYSLGEFWWTYETSRYRVDYVWPELHDAIMLVTTIITKDGRKPYKGSEVHSRLPWERSLDD